MSDGPNRSLPMRRVWKRLARRAAKEAFSVSEVCEALPHALGREFREAPLDLVRGILLPSEQASFFDEDRCTRLEAARQACRGSAAGNALIDSAIAAVLAGYTGESAYLRAVEGAFEDCTHRAIRSIEEHCLREGGERNARFIRDRLDDARKRCNFKQVAADLTSRSKPRRASDSLPRYTGIDDGPPQ